LLFDLEGFEHETKQNKTSLPVPASGIILDVAQWMMDDFARMNMYVGVCMMCVCVCVCVFV